LICNTILPHVLPQMSVTDNPKHPFSLSFISHYPPSLSLSLWTRIKWATTPSFLLTRPSLLCSPRRSLFSPFRLCDALMRATCSPSKSRPNPSSPSSYCSISRALSPQLTVAPLGSCHTPAPTLAHLPEHTPLIPLSISSRAWLISPLLLIFVSCAENCPKKEN
jgi:hypothetical protein